MLLPVPDGMRFQVMNPIRKKPIVHLNWVTYCNDSSGMAFESPVSKGILKLVV